MKAIITNTPIANSTACRMWAPLVAELEQNRERPAAGKGRAEHLGADQDRGRDHGDDAGPDDLAGGLERAASSSMTSCFAGRNLSEKRPAIKRKRPKKARSRDIAGGRNMPDKYGIFRCQRPRPAQPRRPRQSAPRRLADAAPDPALRRDQAGTFPAGLRAGLRRSLGRDRRHQPRSGGAGLRQHHHGAGALRQAADQGRRPCSTTWCRRIPIRRSWRSTRRCRCGWRGTGIRS